MKTEKHNILIRDILKEIGLDKETDHLSHVKDATTKLQTYQFIVNGIKYMVHFALDMIGDDMVLEVSFRNITAIEKLKSKKRRDIDDLYSEMDRAKYGLTKTGNAVSVFNEIYNVVIKYIENKKPTYIKYEAVEDNRKRLYSLLIKRAEKETTLKFERLLTDPTNNVNLTNTSQVFVYQIQY
jgi:hypothetical protein